MDNFEVDIRSETNMPALPCTPHMQVVSKNMTESQPQNVYLASMLVHKLIQVQTTET